MPTDAPNRITRLRISGFRSLREVELGLGGFAVLIGENGSGKSSLVGRVGLALQIHGRKRFAVQLSDGTLSYLALVAAKHPVLVATHSDTLLDCLTEPVKDTVVCSLDAEGDTHLRHLDEGAFERWRAEYRGLGQLRVEGWLEQVLESTG